jgi:hypothetical protein
MVLQSILVALLAAITASGLPLNINLGAYSPALVVGDGEISFGNSPERASQILQTLASGAQNGAIPIGAPAPVAAAPAALPQTPAVAAASVPAAGISSPIVYSAPDAAAAATPETNNQQVEPTSFRPAEFISHKIDSGFNPNLKYPVVGKRSVVVPNEASAEAAKMKIKRDIQGFREALAFARDALRNSPRVELGTENAGVGIIVNAGENVPINSAANGARPPNQPAKRSVEPEVEKLGMTLIAISEI